MQKKEEQRIEELRQELKVIEDQIHENTEVERIVDLVEETICKLEQVKQQANPTILSESYVTDAELSELLHVSPRTTLKWRSEGLVSYIQISKGKVIYPASAIRELLALGYHPAWAV